MGKVVFIHPDLGIGGAERLVVDAALALKKKGHDVCFITAHHDPTHCFSETINGELKVISAGDWLPRSSFGMFYAFWAYIRMLYIAFYLIYFSGMKYDVAFVDQISACIPILKLKKSSKTIFYCHYPDQLLTTHNSFLKNIYRSVLDRIELETTKIADVVLVNSRYTANVFRETFPSVSFSPSVLYPSLNLCKFESEYSNSLLDFSNKITFLSLNRYEKKKNVMLAIEAFHKLLSQVDKSHHENMHLVISGGYDNRVKENIEYFEELNLRCISLDILPFVTFYKSPDDDLKISLLKSATCLLYTPDNEHFGIVPIEAMYVGTPVIAVASGGPLETIIDGKTGFLREPTAQHFANAMKPFIDGSITKQNFSSVCKEHVILNFSFEKFASSLHEYVQTLLLGN